MPDQQTSAIYRTGIAHLDAGRHEEALASLKMAYEAEPDDATIRSSYGLCLGLAERRFEEASELCRSASRKEFFNPDHYLNLARLHLGFGFKTEAVRYLRRARMIDPGNADVDRLFRTVGRRRRPVLSFLPRNHLVNRCLGAVRHGLQGRRGELAEAS